MILVDSNIPMYLVGADHPNKGASRLLVQQYALGSEPLVTDAEVFQEILHRYVSINRREAITPAFEALRAVVENVFPVTGDNVERAREIVLAAPDLSARDALHIAVMEEHAITRIMSFDVDYDRWQGLSRLFRP